MGHPISRRSLFKGAGAAAAAAVIAPGCERPQEVQSQRAPYSFLNADDAAFIEAAGLHREMTPAAVGVTVEQPRGGVAPPASRLVADPNAQPSRRTQTSNRAS